MTRSFPPDDYYIALRDDLEGMFPGETPELLDHVVPLVAAFDTASAFAMSFGVSKFQLAQAEVKLVGEIVGREGCSPNPELVVAVKNWPPVRTLKDLQAFLGTVNYARRHMGPAFSRIASPLRPLLKPGAEFPPTPVQEAAIEAPKELLVEGHKLAVPDEEAAIRAAAAWQSGSPPEGRPYEAGADTSKIAMGGVMGGV